MLFQSMKNTNSEFRVITNIEFRKLEYKYKNYKTQQPNTY